MDKVGEVPEGQHVEGGIFTPWDKVLDRIERQYEQIIAKLDAKVDVNTFQSFQATYEARHDRVVKMIEDSANHTGAHMKAIDVMIAKHEQHSERYIPMIVAMDDRIETLEKDRVTREAVKKDRRLLYAGGGVLGFMALLNFLINVSQQIVHL